MTKDQRPISSKAAPDTTLDRVTFEQDAVAVLGALRSALSDMLGGTSHPTDRAIDVQRAFGVDAALAWSIFRAATAANPLEAGTFVPGSAAMKKLLKGAHKAGVSQQTTDAVHAAHERLETLIERHAGNKTLFETMLGDLLDEGHAASDLKQKRAAFRANAHLWGLTTEAVLNCKLIAPSHTGNLDDCDMVQIRGIVGARRVRSGRVFRTRFRSRQTDGDTSGIVCTPLDPDETTVGGYVSLLTRFCSKPMPQVRLGSAPGGDVLLDVLHRDVGLTGEATLFIGWQERPGIIGGRTERETFSFYTKTPTRVWYQDLWMHRDFWNRRPPSVHFYTGRELVGGRYVYDEANLLPVQESIVVAGEGLSAATAPGVPNYRELARLGFEAAGWSPDAFRCYRVRVDYPVLHAFGVVRFGDDA